MAARRSVAYSVYLFYRFHFEKNSVKIRIQKYSFSTTRDTCTLPYLIGISTRLNLQMALRTRTHSPSEILLLILPHILR